MSPVDRKPVSNRSLLRLGWLIALVAVAAVGGLGAIVSWSVDAIDRQSVGQQRTFAAAVVADRLQELPIEQDSSAIWDEAVSAVNTNDEYWLSENLVEWLGDYYDLERVYILDPDSEVLQAAVDGEPAENSAFEMDAEAMLPLVARLREQLDTLGSVTLTDGAGISDIILTTDGVALASVRPILMGEETQALPSDEVFLHAVVERLDQGVLGSGGARFGLSSLSVMPAGTDPGDKASIALSGSTGDQIAMLTWEAARPASLLVARLAPAVTIGVALAFLAIAYLLRRLRLTTAELHASEAHAQYLAFHDPLTGVPNRALFEDRLERGLVSSRDIEQHVALHLLDLDRFKHVNDTLGHLAGDQLIRSVAQRLQDAVRPVDTVARLGGDEFAVIQVNVADELEAERFAQHLIDALREPFHILGDEVRTATSVGVALSKDHHASASDMLRKADIALYEAKSRGRGRYDVFVGDMDAAVAEQRALERDLKATLSGEQHGLSLAFQPLFAAATGDLVGIEALARWQHPTKGMIPPDRFVPLAEERGLILQLGQWVLTHACRFAASTDVPWVAVNVSPLQFREERFVDRVMATLEAEGLAPDRLQIEITEGLLLQNSQQVQATLHELRQHGIMVALDDFGTGYSSISYLRTYGVDKLKIDRSFVDQLGQGTDVDEIVRAIIDLAQAMHLKVAAEGVETADQQAILVAMGCTELQGFHLARPLDQSALRELLDPREKRARA